MRRFRARGIVLCFVAALALQIIAPATLYAAPRPEASPSVAAGPPLATLFGSNVLQGLGATALKANGDEGGWPRTNAADGSDTTHWSGLPSQGSVVHDGSGSVSPPASSHWAIAVHSHCASVLR